MDDSPNNSELLRQLERLAEKVGGLTVAVEHERDVRAEQVAAAREHVDAVGRVDRRFRVVFAVLLLLALLGSLAMVGVWARNSVITCQNTNVARSAIRDSFGAYTDALVAVPPEIPLTVDEQAARETRVANFRADVDSRLLSLKPRDCSVRGAMFPRQVEG